MVIIYRIPFGIFLFDRTKRCFLFIFNCYVLHFLPGQKEHWKLEHRKECKKLKATSTTKSATATTKSKLTTSEELGVELVRATMNKNITKVKRLLKQRKRISFDVNVSITKLEVYGDSVDYAERRSPYCLNANKNEFTNPLIIAIEYNFIGIVNRLLLEKDIAINKKINENGETPLFVACKLDRLPIVDRLLQENSININLGINFIKDQQSGRPGFYGINPLLIASYLGHVHIVDRLLQEKGKININYRTTDVGIDAVMMASQGGHTKVVQRLLREIDLIEDINREVAVGTALSIAKEFNHDAIIQLLIAAGAT